MLMQGGKGVGRRGGGDKETRIKMNTMKEE